MARLLIIASLLLLVFSACSADNRVQLSIYHTNTESQLVADYFEFLPIDHRLIADNDPSARARSEKRQGLQVSLVVDLDCEECYQLERTGNLVIVHAADPLGLQYGLSQVLEDAGVRFFHPFASYLPATLELHENTEAYGQIVEPEQKRRGLHLHTLHPNEAYYAFWEPSEQNLEHARRIVDWTIKNRGNFLQWVALDNIYREPAQWQPWHEHTKAILEYLHGRGMEAGISIQLFGASSLQQGFNLINFKDGEGDEAQAIAAGYQTLLEGLRFENVGLTFGEFFSADSQRFIDTVNLSYQLLQEASPGTEMSATIHVGKNEELIVDYQGKSYLYYFLVQFANEAIVPWVHTVMYYDLFEDAGGAYHHDDFSEHREFLLGRLEEDKRVGYHPETAYWIAFDNSVPTYIPLYMRTRWLDLASIREETQERGGAELDEHILFTTGWEWGYWQNDYTALRASHTLPGSWQEPIRQMYEPWGDAGSKLAEGIIELAEAQSTALIDQRLAAYLAGRDIAIDAGRYLNIVSQPDRPSFEQVSMLTKAEADDFRSLVLAPLEELADTSDRVARDITNLKLPQVWLQEIRDGVAISAARTRFAHTVFAAALDHGQGKNIEARLALADELIAQARVIVDRRHAHFFHPNGELLTTRNENATIYQWGYLRQAHDLCYWHRERIEIARLIGASDEPPPTCLFQ